MGNTQKGAPSLPSVQEQEPQVNVAGVVMGGGLIVLGGAIVVGSAIFLVVGLSAEAGLAVGTGLGGILAAAYASVHTVGATMWFASLGGVVAHCWLLPALRLDNLPSPV